MLKLSNISTYLSYSVSCITFLFGTVILSGIVFQYVPGKLRLSFGAVLVLWGIYRFVATRMRVRQLQEKDEEA